MSKKGFIPLKELEQKLFKKEKKTENLRVVKQSGKPRPSIKNQGGSKKPLLKELSGNLPDPLQVSRSRLMAGSAVKGGGSPLEITLQQSESLKAAQARIGALEGELQKLRQDNESLVSAGEVLKENRERLLAENEELRRSREESQESFEDEKGVLLNTLEEMKKEQSRLSDTNKNLEKRLSVDLQSIRARELALEGQMEIMKLEGTALQREKDARIIDLQKESRRLNNNLLSSHKKIQELQTRADKLRESVRKSLSVLRATIHNLEGLPFDTEHTSVNEADPDGEQN